MKFIVDAQLPYQMALFIRRKGFEAIHTNDLPKTIGMLRQWRRRIYRQ